MFGSFARGEWAPGGDLDVLGALREAKTPVRECIPSLLPGRFPVPVDVFPFTRAELEEGADSPVVAVARARLAIFDGTLIEVAVQRRLYK